LGGEYLVRNVGEAGWRLPEPIPAPRVLSVEHVKYAMGQVNEDQSTWRDGPRAIHKLREILGI